MAPALLSIQVGRPRLVDNALGGTPFRSGICKRPVAGPILLGPAGLPGDGQESRRYHGGPDKALLCYPFEHYAIWRAELAGAAMIDALEPGGFGENFTTAGLAEEVVCLGDVYAVGAAIIEVREPREPCSKLARRLGVADLVARVRRTGRGGWYCGVRAGGEVAPGAAITLRDRPLPAWPIARVARALSDRDARAAAALLAVPGLAAGLNALLCKAIRGPS